MSATLAIGTIGQLDYELASIHDLIPTLDDDELLALYRAADELSNGAWLIQAHALWEARQRQRNRQDTSGTVALCRGFEVSLRRAEELILVWDHFGEQFGNSRARARELPLPKRFYIEATVAADPPGAIAKAEDRKAVDPGYGYRDFKRDIRIEKAQEKRKAEPMGLSESEVIEKIRVIAAPAMRRLLAATEAVKPIAHYKPDRVAVVVGEDDGWPAVVRLARWVLRVEETRAEEAKDAAD